MARSDRDPKAPDSEPLSQRAPRPLSSWSVGDPRASDSEPLSQRARSSLSSWPVGDPRAPDSEPVSQRAPRSSSRRKVMVIDDSEIVLDATKAMLLEGGFDVVTCDSPIGAVLRVISERPDVILVDLDMASIPGDRVIASLKSGPRTARIPVCLYTGQDASTAREALKRSGADALIEKTWDALSLAQAVRRALAR